jgi:hypothetical protein
MNILQMDEKLEISASRPPNTTLEAYLASILQRFLTLLKTGLIKDRKIDSLKT